MGKKNKVPKAPDYSPFIDILKKSSDKSMQLADQQMQWAMDAYEKDSATAKTFEDFAFGAMDKMADWGDQDRELYENTTVPLYQQFAAEAQDWNTPERQEYEAGLAEAKVTDAFEDARRAAAENAEKLGIDPSQANKGLDFASRMQQASATVGQGNAQRMASTAYGHNLMNAAISQGQGLRGSALAGETAALGAGTGAVNTGLATTASGSNTMGTPQGYMGLGQSGAGGAAQVQHTGYSDQMAGYQAKQDQSSGWGKALGTIGSFFLAEGGAIPEDPAMMGQNIPPEASPSGGAIEDDIPGQVMDTGEPIQVNAGEFVMPKDVVRWMGEKGMQQFILKARKEMGDPNQAPAQPEGGPPPGGPPPGGPPIPPRGVGAIPEMEGVA